MNICALSTPSGGALGIIRLSGPDVIAIASRIFKAANGKPITKARGKTLHYGEIISPTASPISFHHATGQPFSTTTPQGQVIDDVMLSLFRAPHSYTGEDCIELSCHGSPYILNKVLQLLIAQGCRMARPGEYTQRAYLNGKMDLVQAEAVADIIASSSEAAHRMAVSQRRGGFSRELRKLKDQLLHFCSLIELELDFSDHEDLEFANRQQLCGLCHTIETAIDRLVQSFKVGNAVKKGIPVAIVGETNTGKSTLLNALIGEERALVSDIHGTTRDVIEDTLTIDGVLFRFIDTAGIRQTEDIVESLGIERTFQKLSEAEIVLWVIDATKAEEQLKKGEQEILPHCQNKQLIIVLNKCDLLDNSEQNQNSAVCHQHSALNNTSELCTLNPEYNKHSALCTLHSALTITLSAKQDQGLDILRHQLRSLITLPTDDSDVVVTNLRHYEALTQALASIRRATQALADGLPTDLLAEDIRECNHHLSDIIGEIPTPTILNNIFQNFCIGK